MTNWVRTSRHGRAPQDVLLEPPKNPNPPDPKLVARGEQIFKREKCAACHPPPDYTSGELTLAEGFEPPFDHPNRDDIRDRTVGTDPVLALKTRASTRSPPCVVSGIARGCCTTRRSSAARVARRAGPATLYRKDAR